MFFSHKQICWFFLRYCYLWGCRHIWVDRSPNSVLIVTVFRLVSTMFCLMLLSLTFTMLSFCNFILGPVVTYQGFHLPTYFTYQSFTCVCRVLVYRLWANIVLMGRNIWILECAWRCRCHVLTRDCWANWRETGGNSHNGQNTRYTQVKQAIRGQSRYRSYKCCH